MCQFLSLEEVALVSEKHLGDSFITVQGDLLHPGGGFIEGGFVSKIEDHDGGLGMGEIIVDNSAIPLMPSSIPELEGVGFALMSDFLHQDVDADSGMWLVVFAVGVLEDERGLAH